MKKHERISRELRRNFTESRKELNRFAHDLRVLMSRVESLKKGYNRMAVRYFKGFISTHMLFDKGIKDIQTVFENLSKGKGSPSNPSD